MKNLKNSLRIYLSSSFNGLSSTFQLALPKIRISDSEKRNLFVGHIKQINTQQGKYKIRCPDADEWRKPTGFHQRFTANAQKVIGGDNHDADGKTTGFN